MPAASSTTPVQLKNQGTNTSNASRWTPTDQIAATRSTPRTRVASSSPGRVAMALVASIWAIFLDMIDQTLSATAEGATATGTVSRQLSFGGNGSFTRNQRTYRAGRNVKVIKVATANPPMTATANGPQNTVDTMGTMPRAAADAVSRMGRKRCMVAATTASHGSRPSAISASIWT